MLWLSSPFCMLIWQHLRYLDCIASRGDEGVRRWGHLWNDIHRRNLEYVQPLFYDRFSPFCFNAPCQFTPLFNFCSLIFGLTPFGLAAFHYASPLFLTGVSFFIYTHFFQKSRWNVKQAFRCNRRETTATATLPSTNPTWTGMGRMRVSGVVNILHSE